MVDLSKRRKRTRSQDTTIEKQKQQQPRSSQRSSPKKQQQPRSSQRSSPKKQQPTSQRLQDNGPQVEKRKQL